jgi:isopenicillin-N epimerase
MHLSRRGLLGAAAASAAMWGLGARPSSALGPAQSEWAAVRRSFALDEQRVHMAGFLLASHPAPVREAMERHRLGLDEDPVTYVNAHNRPHERRVRAAGAAYFGVRASDLALTDSTTMGLGLVYSGLEGLTGDDEILTTTHDHFATHRALAYASRRTGAPVRRVSLYERIEEVSADEIVARFASGLRDNTRVVAVTWVHSSTGLKLPLARLGEVVQAQNQGRPNAKRIVLCVDGVHATGIEDFELPSLGVDVFIAGTHKSLMGPRGTGVVWCAPRAQHAVHPVIPDFSGGDSWGARMTPGGFHSFEHRWALAEAFAYQRQIGKSKVSARVHALARRLKEGLGEMRHVRLATPFDEELSASLVSFHVSGSSPGEVVRRLAARRIIATRAPYERSYARLAPSLFTSDEDVARALEAMAALR